MTIRRTAGAWAIALGVLAPTFAAPQDLAQDISPFVPPPCVAGQEMFTDVPASNPFCPWIEQLVRDHITGGCGPQLYCPTSSVTRAQMAVFLELAMRGTDTYTVDAGLLDGMDSTDFVSAVNAGTGLSGGGGGGTVTLSLADSFRLPQTCTGGQHPEWTGTAWTCGNPGTGTVTSVGTGAGLTGGPITGAGTVSVAPGGITSVMIAAGSVASAHVADGSIGTADVADGSIGAADVASTQVQLRVTPPCAAGQFVRAVGVDGTPVCAADADSGGTVTSVGTAGGLTGGPITGSGTLSVAPGGITGGMLAAGSVTSAHVADGSIGTADVADGSLGAADVASAQVQLRVAPPCAAGQFVRAVSVDGTPVCAADADSGGTVTSVATGAGLTGGPITGSGTLSVATGGITSAMVADGAIGSADVADGGITAVDVNISQIQLRVAQACAASQYMQAVNVNGTVQCTSDAAHNHFGQQWAASNPISGLLVANSGAGAGLHGTSGSTSGVGVRGDASAATGLAYGVYGQSASTSGNGVRGEASATSGLTYGVVGATVSPTGRGVEGQATSTTGQNFGVQGITYSSSGAGLAGVAYAASGENYGVYGHTNSPSGYGGYFSGRVNVTSHLSVGGNLSVSGTKNFRIDHPLDPANKYLVHAAVESSEVLNMYSGTVVLDANGTATVALPDWFEALNRDFRYQLTCVGGYAPVYIASKIREGRFGIAGGSPGLEVSWQVVGTRSDAHARAHPMVVEPEKPAEERGTYLDPEAHGMPAALGSDYKATASLRRE